MHHSQEQEWPADGAGRHGPGRGPARHGFGGPGGFGPGFPFGPGGFPGPRAPGVPGGPRGRNRRGQVRQSILALLAEQPMNGYQIMQSLAERTQGMWKPSPGAVYPALNQLEDEGLIESFDNEGQKGFRLTDAGSAAAADIETTPWEAVTAAVGGRDPEAMRRLWQEFGSLGGAAKELMRNANPEQITAAADYLAEARRKIYGLLAGTSEMPNSDDLR